MSEQLSFEEQRYSIEEHEDPIERALDMIKPKMTELEVLEARLALTEITADIRADIAAQRLAEQKRKTRVEQNKFGLRWENHYEVQQMPGAKIRVGDFVKDTTNIYSPVYEVFKIDGQTAHVIEAKLEAKGVAKGKAPDIEPAFKNCVGPLKRLIRVELVGYKSWYKSQYG